MAVGVQEGPHAGALAAMLAGPAGIGKTALWEWALERASTLGYQVLISRARIAEAHLPWVGLTNLLRSVAAPLLTALPAPQGQALQALMLPVRPRRGGRRAGRRHRGVVGAVGAGAGGPGDDRPGRPALYALELARALARRPLRGHLYPDRRPTYVNASQRKRIVEEPQSKL
jgi:hypothetical protein